VGDGEKNQLVYSTLGYFYFSLAYHHVVDDILYAVVRLPSGVAYFQNKKKKQQWGYNRFSAAFWQWIPDWAL